MTKRIQSKAILLLVLTITSCATIKTRSRVSHVQLSTITGLPVYADLCVDFKQVIRANSEWRKSAQEAKQEAYWNALLYAPEMDVLVAPIFDLQVKKRLLLFPRYQCKVQGFHGDYCGYRKLEEVLKEFAYVSVLDAYKLKWIQGEADWNNGAYSDLRLHKVLDKTAIGTVLVKDSIVEIADLKIIENESMSLQFADKDSLRVTTTEAADTLANQSQYLPSIALTEPDQEGLQAPSSNTEQPDKKVTIYNERTEVTDGIKPVEGDVNENVSSAIKPVISSNSEEGVTNPVGLDEKKFLVLGDAAQTSPDSINTSLTEERKELNVGIVSSTPNNQTNSEETVIGVQESIDEAMYIYHDYAAVSLIKMEGMQEGVGFVHFENLYQLENAFLELYFMNGSEAKDYNILDEKLIQLEKQNTQQLLYTMQALVVKYSSRANEWVVKGKMNDAINGLLKRADSYLASLPNPLQYQCKTAKEHQMFRRQLLTLYRAALSYKRVLQLQAAMDVKQTTPGFSETNATIFASKENDGVRIFPESLDSSIFRLYFNYGYNKSNPIPRNVTLPKGIVYSIQVGAFRKTLPNNFYQDFGPIRIENVSGDVNRYIAGFFVAEQDAKAALEQIRSLGYPDAFLVAYRDGQRVPLYEVRKN